jgi:hypothetical protein
MKNQRNILAVTAVMSAFLLALLGANSPTFAADEGPEKELAVARVTLGPGLPWFAFMNVFDLPADGGAFVFGDYWGIGDLNAGIFADGSITLSPNTSISRDVPLTDSFWWKPDGSSNKVMDANLVAQDDSLVGKKVVLSGFTVSNTLVSPYHSVAFIRDFAPDYSSFVQATVPLVGGRRFKVVLATAPVAGHHVQYGFETNGPSAPLDGSAALGSVHLTSAPPDDDR